MSPWVDRWLARLRAVFTKPALDADFADELAHHLQLLTEEHIKDGLAPEEARRQARITLGGVEQVKELHRETRGILWLEQSMQDLRYACRQLRRSPGFAAVAVLSLALGIGANTAIFSLVDEVLLKSLPVRNPEELVLFNWLSGPQGFSVPVSGSWDKDPVTGLTSCTSFSQRTFERFRDGNQSLAAVFAFAPLREPTLIADGEAEMSSFGAQLVSGGYHAGLGVRALLGRTITPEDDQPGAAPVAVISYGYWRRRFNGDPAVLGKTITVNNAPATIIGLTPPEFHGALDVGITPDISLPLAMLPVVAPDLAGMMKQFGPVWWLRIMGRLKGDITADQVRGDLAETFRLIAMEDVSNGPHRATGAGPAQTTELPQLAVRPGGQGLNSARQSYKQRLSILMGLVSLVLLIASANVANLLLARGAARRREMAARLALGASRSRLIRQLLAESGLLVLLGGLGGILFAYWGKGLLLAMNLLTADGPESLVLSPGLDWRVLAFSALVTLGTGMLFGLLPAWRATRIDLSAEIQGGDRNILGSRSRLNRALMVVQVALSLVLLVGAGLFVRTLRNLEGIDVGFNRERLLMFRITAKPPAYDSARSVTLHERIARSIGALPGVRATTFSRLPLLSHAGWGDRISVQGRTAPPGKPDFAMLNAIGPDFFPTLGIPLLLGRGFSERDDAQAQKVALINETMAHRYFPGENPVGRRFGRPGPKGNVDVEIVGVVRDAKYAEARNETPPTAYFPFSQEADGEANYAVRTAGDPEALVAAIRQTIRTIDANLPLADVRTQDAQIAKLFSSERLFAHFSSFFGLLAFALVCVGLYGLMSYTVTRRTREIGIRVALGAAPGRLLRMVLYESLRLIGSGVVIGLAVAAALTRLVGGMLYGIVPLDPLSFGGSTLVLVAAAMIAAWRPARTAATVDPVVALRAE